MTFTTDSVAQPQRTTAPRVRYRAQCWLRANTALERTGNDGFAKMLKQSAFRIQTLYRRLMTTYAGEPVGIECQSSSRQAWAFVAPEPGESGHFRIQYFDEDGFSSHYVHRELTDAVETMLNEGYRDVDAGALDRMAATPRWARGVKVAALRQKCQEGLMTFPEMVEAIKAL
jgi:hypothetical protein